jgi:hypothetical protein
MTKVSDAPDWIAVFYRDTDDPDDAEITEDLVIAQELLDPAPARAFLRSIPPIPRAALYGTITAVRDYPPLKFPTSTNMWHLMHKSPDKKQVDMSGIVEARDKHEKLLYRLFCVVDSQAMNHGLEAPALVMLSGTVKKAQEVVPQKVYKEVRRQADRYFSMSPRPVMLGPA